MTRQSQPTNDTGLRSDLTELASEYLKTLLQGDRKAACALILKATNHGVDVRDIYLGVFQPVQYEVGRLWQINAISVAVEHFCTAVTQMAMSQLFPRVITARKNGRSMLGCCVGEELHELGMRIVCDFFEMDGWTTYYMGANCPADAVLSAVEDRRADLLCLSATMNHNLPLMQDLIRRVAASFPRMRILVGGVPFVVNQNLASRIGAHGWAKNAMEGLQLANSLCKAPPA